MKNKIVIKKTSRETKCRKCGKNIYKKEPYWRYSSNRNYCKKCASDVFKCWIREWTVLLYELDCDPTKCNTCNRKMVCIT